MRKAKTYWQSVSVDTEHSRDAVKSWFSPVCDGMRPEKCEVLCDVTTDREKKIRAVMVDKDGSRHQAVRTRGKTYSISIKPLASDIPPTEAEARKGAPP